MRFKEVEKRYQLVGSTLVEVIKCAVRGSPISSTKKVFFFVEMKFAGKS